MPWGQVDNVINESGNWAFESSCKFLMVRMVMIVTIMTILVIVIGALIWRIKLKNGFIRVKEEGRTGFSNGWQGCSEGFPEYKVREKSDRSSLQARGKPVLPDSFSQIKILFAIGFFTFQNSDGMRTINFLRGQLSQLLLLNHTFWNHFLMINFVWGIFL